MMPIALTFAPHLAGAAVMTTADNSVGRRAERTNEPDGSLSIKVTTKTCHTHGIRMVRIKNFRIPTGDVVGQDTPHTSLDGGQSPGNAYHLNRVEVRLTYSPGYQIRTDDRNARLKAKCYAHTQCLDKMHPEHPDYGRLWREKLCFPCGWC